MITGKDLQIAKEVQNVEDLQTAEGQNCLMYLLDFSFHMRFYYAQPVCTWNIL